MFGTLTPAQRVSAFDAQLNAEMAKLAEKIRLASINRHAPFLYDSEVEALMPDERERIATDHARNRMKGCYPIDWTLQDQIYRDSFTAPKADLS